MMEQRLIAMDLDGTTVDSAGSLPKRVMEKIAEARRNGHLAAFVTGRAEPELVPLKKECAMVDYIILNNGSKIIRSQDGAVLSNCILNQKAAEEILRFCKKEQLLAYVVTGRGWFVNNRNRRVADYVRRLGYTPRYFNDLSEVPLNQIEGMTVLGEAEKICPFVEREHKELRAVSSEPDCVDIMNLDVNKWNGLKRLLVFLGLPAKRVVAIGDYDNDLEMIREAGTGVAVANARECVKEEADYVTVHDNDHEAVADAIEELVLGCSRGLCIKMR